MGATVTFWVNPKTAGITPQRKARRCGGRRALQVYNFVQLSFADATATAAW